MTDKLNELFQLCGINHFTFVYQKEGDKNYINYELTPDKKIVVNISDVEDKELDNLLDEKLIELKELFK